MLKFAADENFNGKILRGLRRHSSELDIVRIQDTEIAEAKDPAMLEWVARQERVLLTHDVNTIPKYAYERIKAGLPMPGIFVVNPIAPIGVLIEDILLLAHISLEGEWEGQVYYLPL